MSEGPGQARTPDDLGHEVKTDGNSRREASLRTRWQRAIGKSSLPTTTRAVAWSIGSHMDTTGICYLSYPTIAEEAGLKDRGTARRHVRELQRQELVDIVTGGGRRRSNRYQARIPAALVAALELGNGGSPAPVSRGKGWLHSPETVAAQPENGGSPATRSRSTKYGEERTRRSAGNETTPTYYQPFCFRCRESHDGACRAS